MPRNLPHFLLSDIGKPHPFQLKTSFPSRKPSDVPDRAGHAHAILNAIDALPSITAGSLPGLYLEVNGRPNERLKTDSLDSSGLTLLRTHLEIENGIKSETATLFASASGLAKLREKVEQYRTKDTPDREKDGEINPGRPKNADLVQSLAAIVEAGLRALWRSPKAKFPANVGTAHWEIWLEPDRAETFIQQAVGLGVVIGADRLHFPEDVVVIGEATSDQLALAVRRLGGVRALAAPTITADYFDSLDSHEQAAWVGELLQRTTFTMDPNAGYVTLLDTGVSRAHPLIQPALAAADRHAANPAWGLEDIKGHGTQLAGLSLFGDLTPKLQDMLPVSVGHRLESVKLLPDAGFNPHHLLGAVTRNAIDAVEVTVRRRTFTMATTTSDDTPHDGAPTSWSSEIDQLTAGVSGESNDPRLILISAGNIDAMTFGAGHYLKTCDHPASELESPSQAWNAVCVGAYTEKTMLPAGESYTALAPSGDLSPASRTASWTSQWPLKPDVVLEGGNWAADTTPPPLTHGWLSLLTTSHNYPLYSFCFSHDTSAATALAAKQITELWSDYPSLWPETIRSLYVSSARWTEQMKSHLPANPSKGAYALLFRRYGYGVPDLERARRSASNALTLIVQDEITPYGLSEKTGGDVHKELRLFELPWPVEELRKLGNALVTLRVTLSSFIAPNPSEASRGSRYRYASHNLRFKLNRAGENVQQFLARITKLAEPADGPPNEEDDSWTFGSTRRDVGSLHIDQISCPASDLARRNLIAVHPVAGWWKNKSLLKPELPEVRFSLIVEIDAEQLNTELYTEVETKIATMVETRIGLVEFE
jgi:hypothetical protein